jgi:hypothetical protein
MAYFIFTKDLNNTENTIYRIAENSSDLNNLNINPSVYKIIEVNQDDFDAVKYSTKYPLKYNGDAIVFNDITTVFVNKQPLNNYIETVKVKIKEFTNNNLNHTLFNLWNNYYNQLNDLDLDSIQYPLNKSLEQYLKDQNKTSLHPLQLP